MLQGRARVLPLADLPSAKPCPVAPMPMLSLKSTKGNPLPAGGTIKGISTSNGMLRAVHWPPSSRTSRGTVCLLQGRAEFIEKYYETIADLRRRGFHVVAFDWRGQGQSTHPLRDASKGHVARFDDYLRDLIAVDESVLRPLTPEPRFCLAHSMGGTVALLGAVEGRLPFERLVTVAPMLAIRMVDHPALASALSRTLQRLGLGRFYVPTWTNLKWFVARLIRNLGLNWLANQLMRLRRSTFLLGAKIAASLASMIDTLVKPAWLAARLVSALTSSADRLRTKADVLQFRATALRNPSDSIATMPFPGNRLSNDPARYARNAEAARAVGSGAVGDPTIAWLAAAFRAMRRLHDPHAAPGIAIPVLMVAAGADPVVSTPVAERFARRLRAGHIIVLPGARHEILTETDAIRSDFWAAFDAFIPGSDASERTVRNDGPEGADAASRAAAESA